MKRLNLKTQHSIAAERRWALACDAIKAARLNGAGADEWGYIRDEECKSRQALMDAVQADQWFGNVLLLMVSCSYITPLTEPIKRNSCNE